MDIAAEARDYHDRLDYYISQKNLPAKWFTSPEYITLETPEISKFEDLVKKPKKERVIRVPEEDDRFVVAAKLAGVLRLGNLGHISWIKIEELPEQKPSSQPVNLREVDFFVYDFAQVRYFLGARGITHELVEQEDHFKINVEFDNEGNSFSLLNRPIEAIMGEMLLEQRAQELRINQAA